jgi:hypothetical protein
MWYLLSQMRHREEPPFTLQAEQFDNVTLKKEPDFLGYVGGNTPHITQKIGDSSSNVTLSK